VVQVGAAQLPQELPVREVDPPSLPLEKAAKVEKSFLASVWHLGHEAASPASLKERRSSNLALQLGHTNS